MVWRLGNLRSWQCHEVFQPFPGSPARGGDPLSEEKSQPPLPHQVSSRADADSCRGFGWFGFGVLPSSGWALGVQSWVQPTGANRSGLVKAWKEAELSDVGGVKAPSGHRVLQGVVGTAAESKPGTKERFPSAPGQMERSKPPLLHHPHTQRPQLSGVLHPQECSPGALGWKTRTLSDSRRECSSGRSALGTCQLLQAVAGSDSLSGEN